MEQQTIPKVGMGATFGIGSDCYPYTIHKVSEDRKSIWISGDDHKWIPERTTPSGSDKGHYEYSNRNEKNEKMWQEYTLRKNGRYVRKGSMMNSPGSLDIGVRVYYQDPSF